MQFVNFLNVPKYSFSEKNWAKNLLLKGYLMIKKTSCYRKIGYNVSCIIEIFPKEGIDGRNNTIRML